MPCPAKHVMQITSSHKIPESITNFVHFVLPLSSRWPCQPGTQVHATEDWRGGHVQPSADDPDAAGGGRQRPDSGGAPATPGVGHPSQQSACLPLQQVTDCGSMRGEGRIGNGMIKT